MIQLPTDKSCSISVCRCPLLPRKIFFCRVCYSCDYEIVLCNFNDDQLPSSSISSQGQMRGYRSLSCLFSVGVSLTCLYIVWWWSIGLWDLCVNANATIPVNTNSYMVARGWFLSSIERKTMKCRIRPFEIVLTDGNSAWLLCISRKCNDAIFPWWITEAYNIKYLPQSFIIGRINTIDRSSLLTRLWSLIPKPSYSQRQGARDQRALRSRSVIIQIGRGNHINLQRGTISAIYNAFRFTNPSGFWMEDKGKRQEWNWGIESSYTEQISSWRRLTILVLWVMRRLGTTLRRRARLRLRGRKNRLRLMSWIGIIVLIILSIGQHGRKLFKSWCYPQQVF